MFEAIYIYTQSLLIYIIRTQDKHRIMLMINKFFFFNYGLFVLDLLFQSIMARYIGAKKPPGGCTIEFQ